MTGKAHAGEQNSQSALLDLSAGIDELKEKAKASETGAVFSLLCDPWLMTSDDTICCFALAGMSDDDKKLLATAHYERGKVYLNDKSEEAQKAACKDFTRSLKGISKAVRALLPIICQLLCNDVSAWQHSVVI